MLHILRRLCRVPVTARSRPAGAFLRTVDGAGISEVVHVLQVPRGACPVSGNPLSGTLTLTYTPAGRTIEVVSLFDAIAWACSGAPGAPRSVEELATWAAAESSAAVGGPVTLTADLLLRPGQQRLVVRC